MVEQQQNDNSFDQQEGEGSHDRSLDASSKIVKAKAKNRKTTGALHQSCYVRNDKALSLIQSFKSSNNTPVGTRQEKNKISGLAALLGDKNAFDQAFSSSMVSKPTIGLDKGILGDKVEALMDASRTFMIGDLEYEFDETESIFFIEGPINPRNYHNTPEGCHTCKERWKKATDLKGSHCHFCGMSNCKKCMMKTRKFQVSKRQRHSSTGNLNRNKIDNPERGSICKLCDRKFIIKDMIKGTLDQIDEQSGALSKVVND